MFMFCFLFFFYYFNVVMNYFLKIYNILLKIKKKNLVTTVIDEQIIDTYFAHPRVTINYI